MAVIRNAGIQENCTFSFPRAHHYWTLLAGALLFSGPALAGEEGTLKWCFYGDWTGISSPAIGADGTIYACNKTMLYAINPDGTKKWVTDSIISETGASPAIGAEAPSIHIIMEVSTPSTPTASRDGPLKLER